jgi:L-iditol 2-dehydrogenase
MSPYSSPSPDSLTPEGLQKNLAVLTNPHHDLKVVQTDMPEPREGEVVVHVKATGICGRYQKFHSSSQ